MGFEEHGVAVYSQPHKAVLSFQCIIKLWDSLPWDAVEVNNVSGLNTKLKRKKQKQDKQTKKSKV